MERPAHLRVVDLIVKVPPILSNESPDSYISFAKTKRPVALATRERSYFIEQNAPTPTIFLITALTP